MSRSDQSSAVGYGGVPGLSPKPPPATRRRLSTGHVVMIVAGLLAVLLSYSVLRQASGAGTDVLVAARAIRAGDAVDASMLTTASVKAPSSALTGALRPAQEAQVVGHLALFGLQKGQLVSAQDLLAPVAQPPRMTILIDPLAIPGGPGSVQVGSRIDVIALPGGSTAPYVVGGLVVVKPPDQVKTGTTLAPAASVPIEVAVADPAVALRLAQATSAKFQIRVVDPGATDAPPAGPSAIPGSAAVTATVGATGAGAAGAVP